MSNREFEKLKKNETETLVTNWRPLGYEGGAPTSQAMCSCVYHILTYKNKHEIT